LYERILANTLDKSILFDTTSFVIRLFLTTPDVSLVVSSEFSSSVFRRLSDDLPSRGGDIVAKGGTGRP
jgi:hypothetical protein